jgi:hypothetical protein
MVPSPLFVLLIKINGETAIFPAGNKKTARRTRQRLEFERKTACMVQTIHYRTINSILRKAREAKGVVPNKLDNIVQASFP